MISASHKWVPFKNLSFLLRHRNDLIALVREGHKRCGDYASCNILGAHMYLVSDPAAIETVLHANQDNYIQGEPDWSPYVRALGRGLLYADGEQHRCQRRLVQPAFQPRRIEIHASRILDAIRTTKQHWHDRAETVVDMHQEMLHLTLTGIMRFVFSDMTMDDVHTIAELSGRILQLSTELYFQPAGRLPWLPTPKQARFKRLLHEYDDILYTVIRKRAAERETHDDLLSVLLSCQTDVPDSKGLARPLSERDVRDIAIGVITAGHESTANMLSWAWDLLARNPAVQERLQAELRQVLGGRVATFEDLPRLQYTGNIVRETLRLYPPLWIVARKSKEQDVIQGYPIPAGARMFMSTYIVQRDPRWFRDPEEFDPSRFDEEDKTTRPKFSYFPFGAGGRRCLGQLYAEMTGQLVIANLAQHFEPRAVPGEVAVPDASFFRPKGGLKMRLMLRST